MSNHHKQRPNQRPTGPNDQDRASRRRKMDREMRNTDVKGVHDRDVRGKGRQAVEQQQRERDFDEIDRDLSTDRGSANR